MRLAWHVVSAHTLKGDMSAVTTVRVEPQLASSRSTADDASICGKMVDATYGYVKGRPLQLLPDVVQVNVTSKCDTSDQVNAEQPSFAAHRGAHAMPKAQKQERRANVTGWLRCAVSHASSCSRWLARMVGS